MAKFPDNYDELIAELRRLLKGVAEKVPTMIQGLIRREMGEDIGGGAFKETGQGVRGKKFPPNLTDKLRIISGDLFRSFNEKDKNTLTEVINKESQNIITIGSQLIYANIHEYGGQAGRNLATTIPARPYLNPAIKEFEEKELKILLDDVLTKFQKFLQ